MNTRRDLIKQGALLAGLLAGVLPLQAGAAEALAKSAFDAKTLDELYKALGLGKPVESKEVQLSAPDIAENGAVVPVTIASGAANVVRMLVLVEKNPSVLTASFDVSPAVEAAFQTRVKMGQTSNLYAVAITADKKVLFAQKEVKVTLGGCGG
ncbi:MAG: thiosulfate oxidation carrier protein SoxY [Paucibacter sp.]|nr:thiosulfate oxidation carrier protein SoxY [Roseateles sp.]